MSDAVSVTTYAGVFHLRFSNLNCTIAAKVDGFDAMLGLSEKYHEEMDNPDTVIGTAIIYMSVRLNHWCFIHDNA